MPHDEMDVAIEQALVLLLAEGTICIKVIPGTDIPETKPDRYHPGEYVLVYVPSREATDEDRAYTRSYLSEALPALREGLRDPEGC